MLRCTGGGSATPSYLGVGIVSEVSSFGDRFRCSIRNFQPFTPPLPFKTGDGYLGPEASSRTRRPISHATCCYTSTPTRAHASCRRIFQVRSASTNCSARCRDRSLAARPSSRSRSKTTPPSAPATRGYHSDKEGIAILGHQDAHPSIAAALGLPVPVKGEWLAVRIISVSEADTPAVRHHA